MCEKSLALEALPNTIDTAHQVVGFEKLAKIGDLKPAETNVLNQLSGVYF